MHLAWQKHLRRGQNERMASSIIRKASEALRKENRKQTLRKFNERIDTERLTLSGCAVGGALGAGLIDRRWGVDEPGGYERKEVAKVKGIPVNLAIGAAGVAATIALKKFPGRSVVGGLALGQLCAGAYRMAADMPEKTEGE